ncbi:patatin-like phospholipase family protein, partial [Bacillus cereus]|nr:patatin-like phospholipase family protein [Bacillus cereus]MEB9418057.1 patatin-like phospholipase family protein [Bacillus cereus]
MAYPFRNLVFEGGGVKGSAYIGAIRALNEEGILPEIQRFGGTSHAHQL